MRPGQISRDIRDDARCVGNVLGRRVSARGRTGEQTHEGYYIGVDGCCGTPAGTFTFVLDLVDDVGSRTTIHDGPADGSATSDTSATFAFDSDETDSTFEVRTKDAAGNVGTKSWFFTIR